ncbi:uncharacterized protein BDZ99DRAFT_549023 [Mytilinidion resinicola]|uniref:BTB domain-containing protein n=1 Tax=Mytilinidion resinicola TaxID=574789 RepID=A0A6A6Z0Y3_9PEZI|nr:uncharacterized protein BDZ99DRAFT_549023 [Mytilinidion resinicola]KAF2814822.1 hypothetical protein BDZ99DRAFT_549023 [Mytilinidion resinicola]
MAESAPKTTPPSSRVPCDKAISSINGPTIALIISSDDTTTFHAHEGLICASSLSLRNAMKPERAEMRDDPRSVDMPEDDADTFRTYMQWLYFKHLPVGNDEGHAEGYVQLESIGEDKHRQYPTKAAVNIIYNGTLEGSPARRLLVDFWTWVSQESWTKNATFDMYTAVFLFDVMRSLSIKRKHPQGEKPWLKSPESYGKDGAKEEANDTE